MVEFQKKILYLYYNLYEQDLNRFVKDFIIYPNPTSSQLRSRKVAIKKWLDESKKIENAYIAKVYHKFNISKLKFNNKEDVFPLSSFTDWSFENFKSRVDKYKRELKHQNISIKDYLYIYYFNHISKEIEYLELFYGENNRVEIYTQFSFKKLIYVGKIDSLVGGTVQLIVSSDEEILVFQFSKLDFVYKDIVLGINLSTNYENRKPISKLVAFSKNLLNFREKKALYTYINPISMVKVINEDRSFDTAFKHSINRYLSNIQDTINNYDSKNIYLSLIMDDLTINGEFYLNLFPKKLLKIIDILKTRREKYHFKILYTIEDFNNSIFSDNNIEGMRLLKAIKELSENSNLSFEFIIGLERSVTFNKKFIQKIQYLQNSISIYFQRSETIKVYSGLVLIDDIDLIGIYRLKGEFKYKITDSNLNIYSLREKYKIIKNSSLGFKDILKREYPIMGRWYFYGYGTNNILHQAIFEIEGDSLEVVLKSRNNEKFKGKVYSSSKEFILSSEIGLLTLKRENILVVDVVPFISKQHLPHQLPVMLFAIFSRVKLFDGDIDRIFSNLVDKDVSSYETASFKLSKSLDKVFSEILPKYEAIYSNS